MRLFPHLKRNRRSGNWVYFRRFPVALQASIGKTFFERSLRTSDRKKIPAAWDAAHRDFERMVEHAVLDPQIGSGDHERSSLPTWLRPPTTPLRWDGDLAATRAVLDLRIERVNDAVRAWGERERYDRAQRILNDPAYCESEQDFEAECAMVGACGRQRSWLIHCPPLHSLTMHILQAKGIEVPPFHGAVYQIQRMVEEELREVLEAEERWRNFDFKDMPSKPPKESIVEGRAPSGQPFITLGDLVDQYVSATRKPLKTASKLRMVGRYIDSLHGGPTPLNKVTKALLIRLQTDALKLPARPTSFERTLPFDELVKRADAVRADRSRLTPQAVRSWFNLLGGCLAWGVRADMLDRNPTIGIKPSVHAMEEGARCSFTGEDLRAIFDPANYPSREHPAKFWLPLIALVTGARLNEIGQLLRSDILVEDQPWIIISDEGSSPDAPKRLKNRNSRRKIPVHGMLLQLGFREYVQSRKSKFLFPELPHGERYEPTKAYSQWFGRYLSKVGVTHKSKVFHSFRHTFKDECRLAGIGEEVHDALTGHAGSGPRVGRSYGSGVPDEVLRSAVNRLEFAVVAQTVAHYPQPHVFLGPATTMQVSLR